MHCREVKPRHIGKLLMENAANIKVDCTGSDRGCPERILYKSLVSHVVICQHTFLCMCPVNDCDKDCGFTQASVLAHLEHDHDITVNHGHSGTGVVWNDGEYANVHFPLCPYELDENADDRDDKEFHSHNLIATEHGVLLLVLIQCENRFLMRTCHFPTDTFVFSTTKVELRVEKKIHGLKDSCASLSSNVVAFFDMPRWSSEERTPLTIWKIKRDALNDYFAWPANIGHAFTADNVIKMQMRLIFSSTSSIKTEDESDDIEQEGGSSATSPVTMPLAEILVFCGAVTPSTPQKCPGPTGQVVDFVLGRVGPTGLSDSDSDSD